MCAYSPSIFLLAPKTISHASEAQVSLLYEQRELSITEMHHKMIANLWQEIEKCFGDDPYVIAAEQGISVTIDSFEAPHIQGEKSYSKFWPEAYAIDIYTLPLEKFWDELFPGVSPKLKYKYACWRELWNFWVYSRFASLKVVLNEEWDNYLHTFNDASSADATYFSHYFAAKATGIFDSDESMARC